MAALKTLDTQVTFNSQSRNCLADNELALGWLLWLQILWRILFDFLFLQKMDVAASILIPSELSILLVFKIKTFKHATLRNLILVARPSQLTSYNGTRARVSRHSVVLNNVYADWIARPTIRYYHTKMPLWHTVHVNKSLMKWIDLVSDVFRVFG